MPPSLPTRPVLIGLLLAGFGVTAAAEIHRDVSYDLSSEPSPARRLDIYTPAAPSERARPVMVYVHGGGWTGGDKARVAGKPEWLDALGFILVSVEYRLLPEGRHPAAAADLALALAWIEANIQRFGGDPEALFLVGHSSGGHVVSLVATDGRFLAQHQLSPTLIQGVVCLDTAAFDLGFLIRRLPAARRQRYLDVFGGSPAAWRTASPMHQVAAGKGVSPFLLLVAGAGESTHYLSARFAGRLEAAAVDVTLEVFPHETHASITTNLGVASHPPTKSIERFVGRLLER